MSGAAAFGLEPLPLRNRWFEVGLQRVRDDGLEGISLPTWPAVSHQEEKLDL